MHLPGIVPYHRLRARSHGRHSYADRAETTRTLNLIQEKALTSWVQTLDSAHISSTPEIVEDAANAILKKAGENRVVGHNWAYRFLARLPLRLNYIKQKPKEKSRVESEDYGALLLWFNHLSRVVNRHQFLPHKIYNWDETGYRIGQGKHKVITSRTSSDIPTGGQSESITGIECIAADGWLMLPWFLPKGSLLMEEWSPPGIFTPSPPPDFSSSVTNSPPDTIERVEKLNTKLINDLERIEHLQKSVNRHIQRSIDANTLLSQEMNY
ncbi:Homeodomain-like [Penicillium camemberti]|uniref:Homeodomain-like n=1 Tax=Penicillium camemberti (strain FM 013) TaxID=1429867 RepID=A0A0G4PQP4_PENC3|nr:Homeodomain-like [Penicillium camemberti]